jgi:hypothetical protein
MKIIEERFNMTLAAGSQKEVLETATSSDNTDVIRVVAYQNNLATATTGMVDLGILANDIEVSKFQDIRNYRSREAGYLDNKHCHFPSGQKIRLELRSQEVMDEDLPVQVILIKEVRC